VDKALKKPKNKLALRVPLTLLLLSRVCAFLAHGKRLLEESEKKRPLQHQLDFRLIPSRRSKGGSLRRPKEKGIALWLTASRKLLQFPA
jgi:hypothetical protein